MSESESRAGRRSGVALAGLLAVCVLSVPSAGCTSRTCWDCDVCASAPFPVSCVYAAAWQPERGRDLVRGRPAHRRLRRRARRSGRPSWSRTASSPGSAARVSARLRTARIRVDLSGKTVVPALIDAHQHIGLTNVKDGTHSKDNYTLSNLVEHLERSAYHGVAATMSLGLEFDEALAFELRNEALPDAARFLTSGRGIAATPTAVPAAGSTGWAYRAVRRPRRRVARRSRSWDGHGVDLIKIWVDDRGGTVPEAGAGTSTGRSSTRRMPGACGWRRISARPAGWPTRRT